MIGFFVGDVITPELVAVLKDSKLIFSRNGLSHYRLDLQKFIDHPNNIEKITATAGSSALMLVDVFEGESIASISNLQYRLLSPNETELLLLGEVYQYNIHSSPTVSKDVSAGRFELAVKGMNDGIWDWNILTNEVYYSPRWKSMLGYQDFELPNNLSTWYEMMHPDDLLKTEQIVKDYMAGKADHLYHVTRFLHKDGSSRLIVCRGYIQRDMNNAPVRMVGSHTDITELVEIKQELQQQKELFELAVAASNDGIWDWNLLTNEVYFSPKWKEMFGYKDHEVENSLDAWKQLIFEEDYDQALKLVDDFNSGRIKRFQTVQRFRHKNGKIVYVQSMALNIKNPRGEAVRMVGSHTNITPFINIQQELKCSEAKYRAIIENMNMGILKVDNEDRIVEVFNKFLEITGYERSDLIGNFAHKVLLDENHQLDVPKLIEARKSKESGLFETPIKCKNGEYKWLMVSGTPEIDSQGNVVGSIGIHLDITERKKTELALEEAKKIAEELSTAREMLLARVSHEMRTPMQAFLGFVNYLDTLELPVDAKYYNSEIKLAITALNRLVNDLLDLNSVQQKKLYFKPEPVSLQNMFEHMHSYYQRIVPKNKNLVLQFQLGDSLPAFILIDSFRLQQIVGNLINNAIKYTDSGTIICSILWESTSIGRGILTIEVKDSGIGIPEQEFDNIFKEFVQISGNKSKNHFAGIGLGLSIVKQLVEAMGGQIHLQSTVNIGSTFTIMLPAEVQLVDSKNDKVQLPIDATALEPRRILLVEDNPIISKLVCTYLTNKGLTVEVAHDGEKGYKLAKAQAFDVILMDINMSNMNGNQATVLIRDYYKQNPRIKQATIVALSASVLHPDDGALENQGFDYFIQKPIALPKLFEFIISNSNTLVSTQCPNHNTDDFTFFFNDDEIDDSLKIKIAKTMLHDLNNILVGFQSDMPVMENLKSKVHYLKGSAGLMQMKHFMKKLEQLEEELNGEDCDIFRVHTSIANDISEIIDRLTERLYQ